MPIDMAGKAGPVASRAACMKLKLARRDPRLTDPAERIQNLPSVQGNFSRFREGKNTVRWATDHFISSRGEAPRALQGRH